DVDSERAAVDRGDAEIDEGQQSLGQLARLLDRGAQQLRRAQDRRAMRHHLGGIEEVAKRGPLLFEDFVEDPVAARILDLTYPWHRSSDSRNLPALFYHRRVVGRKTEAHSAGSSRRAARFSALRRSYV